MGSGFGLHRSLAGGRRRHMLVLQTDLQLVTAWKHAVRVHCSGPCWPGEATSGQGSDLALQWRESVPGVPVPQDLGLSGGAGAFSASL